MKTATILVMALFALTSFPLLAQQSPSYSPSTSPSSSPGAQQTNPPSAQPGSVPESQPTSPSGASSSPSASPQTSAGSEASAVPTAPPVEMRPVKAELVSKLDTKTAKTGDNVVVQTQAPVKTATGTEIPKGSKLLGHVLAVQPSAEGKNAQVVLQFDQAQLKGGESVAIHSEIQSIAPAGGDASASASAGMPGAPAQSSATPSGGSMAGGGAGATGSAGSASGATGSVPATPGYAPGSAQSAPGADAATGAPAEGAIVARNGKIAIRRTSVPGVLLANNAPGEQDPRMTQASGILLGAKDVQLDSGTQMVINVAATGAGSK